MRSMEGPLAPFCDGNQLCLADILLTLRPVDPLRGGECRYIFDVAKNKEASIVGLIGLFKFSCRKGCDLLT